VTGFTLVALAAALWGSDALFRLGLALQLPAAAVVFAEHLILVVVTLPLLRRGLQAARSFVFRDWLALVVIGAGASAAATVFFTQAFVYGNPTTPLLLQKLQPVFAVAAAHLLLGERLLRRYVFTSLQRWWARILSPSPILSRWASRALLPPAWRSPRPSCGDSGRFSVDI